VLPLPLLGVLMMSLLLLLAFIFFLHLLLATNFCSIELGSEVKRPLHKRTEGV
jgi:hypothetical protein